MLTGKDLALAIEQAIKKKGVTKTDFSKALGVSAQAVNGWIRSGRIGKDKMFAMMAFFNDTVGPEHWGLSVDSLLELDADTVLIPQYNTGGKGGHGLILRDQPGVIKQWQVSSDWVRTNVPYCTHVNNLCFVTGFGDSMPDTFNPGDPVLVDTGINVCDHDGVYFFRIGNEGFIKRLQRIPKIGIRVLSQNKEYEAWTITEEMDFEVFGKVIKVWRGQTF